MSPRMSRKSNSTERRRRRNLKKGEKREERGERTVLEMESGTQAEYTKMFLNYALVCSQIPKQISLLSLMPSDPVTHDT